MGQRSPYQLAEYQILDAEIKYKNYLFTKREAVVEMVNTIHHGENRGTKPVILYMFYLSQEDLPLAVQHPEIPLD